MNFVPRYSEGLAGLLQKRTKRMTFSVLNFPFSLVDDVFVVWDDPVLSI